MKNPLTDDIEGAKRTLCGDPSRLPGWGVWLMWCALTAMIIYGIGYAAFMAVH